MPLWMKQFFIYHKDRFVSISGDWNLIILSIPIPGIVYLTITFLLDIVPLHFIQAVLRVFQPGTLNPDMVDSCQEKKVPSVPTVFQRSFSWLCSKAPTEAQPVMRRLITLIFAGWLPHDLASSRSCLGLSSGVRPKIGLSNRVLEGSPGRGCAPGAALEGLCF